jgi:hypothetical protein
MSTLRTFLLHVNKNLVEVLDIATQLPSQRNTKRKNVLAEVSGLIGGEDSKPDLPRSKRKSCLSFK